MRGKSYLQHEETINATYENFPLSTAKAINTRDHNDVFTCDAMLVNLLDCEKVSIGTVMEIAWAFAYKKPTVLVTNNNLHKHPMITESVGYIVSDLATGLNIIRLLLTNEE